MTKQKAAQLARLMAGTVIMAAMIARGDDLDKVAKEAAKATDELIKQG
ncbi:hypothetical protein IB262_21200 [Ensifer sp. ENS02]|nr:hypothetical protein [Ensifer sp. ENS02]MBD9522416.1 hypothetical protein [Ensifer sp. ENS02]